MCEKDRSHMVFITDDSPFWDGYKVMYQVAKENFKCVNLNKVRIANIWEFK